MLADVLLNPIFPPDALERERDVQIAGIYAQKDDLLKSASLAMRRALFGDTGYGLDSLGTEETVQNSRPADLKSFHQKLVTPNNCVLAIYGDVKTERSKPPWKRRLRTGNRVPEAPASCRRIATTPGRRRRNPAPPYASRKPATKSRP